MDLTNISNIKKLLSSFGAKAKKDFGQNYLIDEKILAALVDSAEIKKDDTILEIGPGLGVVTRELSEKASKVIVIEKDPKMIEVLKITCQGAGNIEAILGDVLKLNIEEVVGGKYKLVTSLPFYITSPVLKKFLETKYKPEVICMIVQKEVAEKVVAKPGDLSILAISVQLYGDAQIVKSFKRDSFWPIPDVDAAILKIIPFKDKRFDLDTKEFFRIVKAGFGEKRKKLVNSLSGGLQVEKESIRKILTKAGLSENVRAEELRLEDWMNLVDKL